jgi:hypothetical protein
MHLRETVMADESDDHRSHIRKLGDDVKQFIDEVKPLNDLLLLVVKLAAFIGGALLIGYASKERFFYDLSSISVITLLIITFFVFSFLLVLLIFYSFISMLWVSWLVYHMFVWISGIRRRPVIVQLRPYITWRWALYSFGLFVVMAVFTLALYLQKREVPWPIVGYFLFTGFVINCVVTAERRPGESKPTGESERLRLLFGFVGLPIVALFYFGAFGSLLNSTMTFLNFRSPPDQLLRLNEQAYDKVRDIAAYASVKVRPCQVGKDFWVLRDATLVWHGVGATAYLLIPGTGEASLLIPLPNDAVEVLYSTGIQLPQYCAA